jgi:hypothetical protein
MADAKIKILFLAANPTNETRLRLGAESTKIKEALQLSSARDQFIFAENHAVRVDSLMRLVLQEDPHIVHFSGHGSNEGALIFEDHIGNAMEADPVGIANLFKLAGENTRLIVLNACYSRRQANELAKHVDAVIGMDSAILDETAVAFSIGLYEALGERRDVNRSFELAKTYVQLQSLPDAELPQLIERKGVPASSISLLPQYPQ